MFQFTQFPFSYTIYSCMDTSSSLTSGFPHSDIHGSLNICFSPWLFAAYHVLLRLLVPRHSPYALTSLTYFFGIFIVLLVFCLLLLYYIFFNVLSFLNVQHNFNGGPDKNRTCDLTLIRRAL